MDSLLRTLFKMTQTRDDAEAQNDFWSVTSNFICRHRVEPRVKLYMPREESFPVPTKYIDVTRKTFPSLDVLLEKIVKITGTRMEKENYQMHGQASQDLFLLNERPPDGYCMVREETDEETTSRPDNVWPDMWKHMSAAAKSKSGLSRNQSSIMPDNFVVSSSMNQMMEIPMPAAMP